MEKRTIPYTGEDLIAIGRAVNKITRRLKAFEVYSDSDLDKEGLIADLRVEVMWEENVVGFIGYEDGWLGFFPYAVRDEE